MALALLGNGNSLQMCKEVYGIVEIQYQLWWENFVQQLKPFETIVDP
jgi:hypothetical protein